MLRSLVGSEMCIRDRIRLEPKVLRNVEKRSLKKKVLGYEFDFPFGFAPMGMTNLSWPGADSMLAAESARNNIPTCVSMASTTTLEKMYELSKGHAWMQLYIFQDENFVMELLDRAKNTGYEVAILTVDVPCYPGELEMIKMVSLILLRLVQSNFLILRLTQFGLFRLC